MNQILFLSNNLMNPKLQRELGIPLLFISFALIEGKMYKHFRNDGTFVTNSFKKWGNSVTYGALFLCKDFDFYGAIIDSYHSCSMSSMKRNHIYDVNHRIKVLATPITFNTIDDLAHLKYYEREPIEVDAYLANPKHPKIIKRIGSNKVYRIQDNIDSINFIQLFREVGNE